MNPRPGRGGWLLASRRFSHFRIVPCCPPFYWVGPFSPGPVWIACALLTSLVYRMVDTLSSNIFQFVMENFAQLQPLPPARYIPQRPGYNQIGVYNADSPRLYYAPCTFRADPIYNSMLRAAPLQSIIISLLRIDRAVLDCLCLVVHIGLWISGRVVHTIHMVTPTPRLQSIKTGHLRTGVAFFDGSFVAMATHNVFLYT